MLRIHIFENTNTPTLTRLVSRTADADPRNTNSKVAKNSAITALQKAQVLASDASNSFLALPIPNLIESSLLATYMKYPSMVLSDELGRIYCVEYRRLLGEQAASIAHTYCFIGIYIGKRCHVTYGKLRSSIISILNLHHLFIPINTAFRVDTVFSYWAESLARVVCMVFEPVVFVEYIGMVH